MTKRSRRIHLPSLKATVALAAIQGRESISQIAERFDVHPNLVAQWRDYLRSHAAAVFGPSRDAALRAQLRTLSLENDFLSRALGRGRGPSARP